MKSKNERQKKIQIGSHASTSYNSNVYDIDLVRDCKELFVLIDEQKMEIKLVEGTIVQILNSNKEERKKAVVAGPKAYCISKEIDFDYHFKYDRPVIIDSSTPFYKHQLAYTLMWFDINKISSLLTYQKDNYEGEDFSDIIEHLVYPSVKALSISDTNRRLEKIMGWVSSQTRKPQRKIVVNKKLELSMILKTSIIYEDIMKLIDEIIPSKKSAGKSGLVMAVLKELAAKKYYREGIKLNSEMAQVIAKNTFNVVVKSNKTFYSGALTPKEAGTIPLIKED